jgi:hypothetical protein
MVFAKRDFENVNIGMLYNGCRMMCVKGAFSTWQADIVTLAAKEKGKKIGEMRHEEELKELKKLAIITNYFSK